MAKAREVKTRAELERALGKPDDVSKLGPLEKWTYKARNGQVVVARLHDEVTVKRLHRRGAMVELLPENPDFEPIVVDTRRELFALEGIGVGVIRAGQSL